jgi:hypothetical protein
MGHLQMVKRVLGGVTSNLFFLLGFSNVLYNIIIFTVVLFEGLLYPLKTFPVFFFCLDMFWIEDR